MEYPLLGNLFVTSFTGKYDYLLDFLVRTLLYLFGCTLVTLISILLDHFVRNRLEWFRHTYLRLSNFLSRTHQIRISSIISRNSLMGDLPHLMEVLMFLIAVIYVRVIVRS